MAKSAFRLALEEAIEQRHSAVHPWSEAWTSGKLDRRLLGERRGQLAVGLGERRRPVGDQLADLAPPPPERLPDRVLVYSDDGEAAAVAAHERGLRPETVLVRRSSLEDVFLRLTGRSLIE